MTKEQESEEYFEAFPAIFSVWLQSSQHSGWALLGTISITLSFAAFHR